jgi:PAS domain S-box-containing protein
MKSNATQILQHVKAEWESTVDSVPQLICVLRKDGTVLRANKTIELWSIGALGKVNGKTLHSLMHPGCRSRKCYLKQFMALSDKVLVTDEGVEYRGYDDVLNKTLLIQLIPVGSSESDTLGHMVIIFRDISQMNLSGVDTEVQSHWNMLHNISDSNQNELDIIASMPQIKPNVELDFSFIEKIKREWESAVDSLPQIICLLNESGAIVRANRAVEQWKLADVTSVIGTNMHDLLHKGCTDEDCYLLNLNQQISEVLASGLVAECQKHDTFLNRHLHFQINVFSSKRTSNNGLVVMLVSDVTDIRQADSEIKCLYTKLEKRIKTRTLTLQKVNQKLIKEIELRKLAEKKFTDSRQKFSHLVEMMNEGMVIQDLNQIVTYANRHLLKILGLPRSVVVGQPFTNFVDTDFIDAWTSGSLKHVKSVEASYVFKMRGAEGKTFWVKGAPQPLIDADKNSIGSYAVITDINDQIEIEQKLLKTEIKLRSLAKQVLFAQELERKRIASELHDGIGQTLSAIKFYVENNIKDLTVSPTLSVIQQFESVIPKLQGAIEEVRRISMDLRPSLLDDIGIIATLNWFCRESKQSHPNVDFSFDKSNVIELDVISSLKTEMFRVVQEAVNNASKYSQAKNVNISLHDTGKAIRLEIKDDGIGFDYFKVANQQGYAESKGMGLVSMRERVQNSGGQFTVNSDETGTHVICLWFKEKREFVDHRSGRRDRRNR